MKFFYILVLLIVATASSIAQIWQTNPANGHAYTLVNGTGWTDCQNQAAQLGGSLAVINNPEENSWILETFYDNYGENRSWIGMYHYYEWRWITDEPVTYTNWAPGQPDSATIYELYVEMYIGYTNSNYPPGTWNDNADTIGNVLTGIVEVDPVPEPTTIAVLGIGLLAAIKKRRRA